MNTNVHVRQGATLLAVCQLVLLDGRLSAQTVEPPVVTMTVSFNENPANNHRCERTYHDPKKTAKKGDDVLLRLRNHCRKPLNVFIDATKGVFFCVGTPSSADLEVDFVLERTSTTYLDCKLNYDTAKNDDFEIEFKPKAQESEEESVVSQDEKWEGKGHEKMRKGRKPRRLSELALEAIP